MFDWCFTAIKNEGVDVIIRGNSKLSDLIDTTQADAINGDGDDKFARPLDIRLNVIESLSLAYLALYIRELFKNGDDYFIGVEIEDAYKARSEEHIGDGLIRAARDMRPGAQTPVQETKVITFVPRETRRIEDIAIANINKKIAKRKDYPEFCTLLISVLPDAAKQIDYRHIVDACDLFVYDQVFALEYEPGSTDLRKCQIRDLLALKKGERSIWSPIIAPQLRYSEAHN